MKPFAKISGKLMLEARLKKRRSQSEMALLLGYKNGQFFSNIERGKCNIPTGSLAAVSDELEIQFDKLLDAHIADVVACERYEAIKAFSDYWHKKSGTTEEWGEHRAICEGW
jgi:transcriptional regulator with XRE-family HTH domain